MKHFNFLTGTLLALLFTFCCAGSCVASPTIVPCSTPTASSALPDFTCLAAAPRWWEDAVQWVRSLGWDRSRLVQIWLFFMLIGLYIILRIKPRG